MNHNANFETQSVNSGADGSGRLRKRLLTLTLALAAGATTTVAATAQDAPPAAGGPVVVTDPGYAPAVRYPDNGFTFLRHSSTAAEGYMRGAAAYVRAAGAANLDNSLAAMNYQEAYRRSLENTLRYAETYYARRDLWFDYQEAHGRKPLTMEGYRRIAAAAGADRLTQDQYDPATGKIRWPALLQANILAPHREQIEEAMATRSVHETGMGSRTYEMVRQATQAMQVVLDGSKKEIPTHLYVDASKFLESVRFESRFAPPTDGDGQQPAAANPAANGQPAEGEGAAAPVAPRNNG